MLTLLHRNRDFAVFLVTQSTSNVGDAARNVIIPLLVLQLTDSPAIVAAILLVQTAANFVLRLPFGALVDRWDRRRTMLLADLGRGILTLVVPLVAILGGPVLPTLVLVVMPLSVLTTFFSAGFGAITPALVDEEDVGGAYGLMEGAESFAWVVGPLLAGLVTTSVGPTNALIIDALSFFVSVAGLAAIRTPVRASTAAARGRQALWREIADGLRFLAGHATLRRVVLSWTLYGSIGYGVVAGLIYVGSHTGNEGTTAASVAVAAYSAGSVLGTLAAGSRQPGSPWLTISASLLVSATGAALVASAATIAIIAGALVFGLGEGFFLVIYLSLQATVTPDEMRGRITSASSVLTSLAAVIGVGWMGLALQWLGGREAFALVAVLALALSLGLGATRPRAERGRMAASQPEP